MSKTSLRFSRSAIATFFALTLLLASSGVFAGPVDINTADAKTLASELNGIGAAKAEAIVAYRAEHGPLDQLADLIRVPGIGRKTVEKIEKEIATAQ